MAVPLRTRRVNDGGLTDDHDATSDSSIRCLYVKPVAPRAANNCLRFNGDHDNDCFGIMINLFGGKEYFMKLYNAKFSVKCASKLLKFGYIFYTQTEFQKGSWHWPV